MQHQTELGVQSKGIMQGGRMVACCACEGGKSVASASSQGTLHIWRVEYSPRTSSSAETYSGLTSTLGTLSCPGSVAC